MSGGSWNHARIISNLNLRLRNALEGRDCSICLNEMRVQVSRDFYAYPDVLVVCGEPEFLDLRTDVVSNPLLIIEVLSPSTEAYNRGLKAQNYRRMASLREVVLVSQTEPRIEVYRRHSPVEWLLADSVGLDSTCRFDSIQCSMAASEIYENVKFDAE
jgi:Uma2 family endonuclease